MTFVVMLAVVLAAKELLRALSEGRREAHWQRYLSVAAWGLGLAAAVAAGIRVYGWV